MAQSNRTSLASIGRHPRISDLREAAPLHQAADELRFASHLDDAPTARDVDVPPDHDVDVRPVVDEHEHPADVAIVPDAGIAYVETAHRCIRGRSS
ncbi:MAG: hypothetical protein QM736_18690 [Vicinamibacterales bacterium]